MTLELFIKNWLAKMVRYILCSIMQRMRTPRSTTSKYYLYSLSSTLTLLSNQSRSWTQLYSTFSKRWQTTINLQKSNSKWYLGNYQSRASKTSKSLLNCTIVTRLNRKVYGGYAIAVVCIIMPQRHSDFVGTPEASLLSKWKDI